jgi:hypothetical protein
MDPKALRNLHMDVRLQSRDRWIAGSDLAKELEELPDVSDKIRPPEEEKSEASAAQSNPATTAAPQLTTPPAAEPAMPSFGDSPPQFGRED